MLRFKYVFDNILEKFSATVPVATVALFVAVELGVYHTARGVARAVFIAGELST